MSSKTLSIERRYAKGPGNMLFAGAFVYLSAREFLQAGAVKGLRAVMDTEV